MQPTIIHGLDGRGYVVIDERLIDVNHVVISEVMGCVGLFLFLVADNDGYDGNVRYEFPYEDQATAARAEMIAKLEQIKKEIGE